METLGFTPNDKNIIYMVLSAILNLGNIQFESVTNGDGCSIQIQSRAFLCNAAALLKITEFELEDALTTRTIKAGTQTFKYTIKISKYLILQNSLHPILMFQDSINHECCRKRKR